MIQTLTSTPSFSQFNPDIIPYQREVIDYVNHGYDYKQGALEILLSGAVGSAKSLLAAHLGCYHCLNFSGARLLLGRKALPDLKDTIYNTILEHLDGTKFKDGHRLIEGRDYFPKSNIAAIKFRNGSEVISRSWADKRYYKMRSLNISAAIFEELTENNEDDEQAYVEMTMRLGRLPHIPQAWAISCSNPDTPAHWAYKRFIAKKKKTTKVFYSITSDNPFLPKEYINKLKETLDPKLAQRMIYGKWVDIRDEFIYHQYCEKNFIDEEYKVKPEYPIYVSFDFNIGLGKPLSSCVMQIVDDKAHIFGEAVIHGLRTLENVEALASKGYFNYPVRYIVTGDASGKHKDTRSNRSDYDILKKFFSLYEQEHDGRLIDFKMKVPAANPPIKKRQNCVNAYCFNELKQRRLFVYKGSPTSDEGLRLTKLKKGSYVEDDSKEYQHITTAIGYALNVIERAKNRKPQSTKQL